MRYQTLGECRSWSQRVCVQVVAAAVADDLTAGEVFPVLRRVPRQSPNDFEQLRFFRCGQEIGLVPKAGSRHDLLVCEQVVLHAA